MSPSYTRHTVNPYNGTKQTRRATIYHPDDYSMALIVSMPAMALRILFIIAANINHETGRAKVSKKDMRELLGSKRTNISAAKTVLIHANLIQPAKQLDEFYINPAVFRPISVDF